MHLFVSGSSRSSVLRVGFYHSGWEECIGSKVRRELSRILMLLEVVKSRDLICCNRAVNICRCRRCVNETFLLSSFAAITVRPCRIQHRIYSALCTLQIRYTRLAAIAITHSTVQSRDWLPLRLPRIPPMIVPRACEKLRIYADWLETMNEMIGYLTYYNPMKRKIVWIVRPLLGAHTCLCAMH